MRPKANPNRGPGDFAPPDPPELADVFLDEAREQLEANRDDPDEPVDEDAVTALAWELQDKARRESLDAEAEMQAWDDDLPY